MARVRGLLISYALLYQHIFKKCILITFQSKKTTGYFSCKGEMGLEEPGLPSLGEGKMLSFSSGI